MDWGALAIIVGIVMYGLWRITLAVKGRDVSVHSREYAIWRDKFRDRNERLEKSDQ